LVSAFAGVRLDLTPTSEHVLECGESVRQPTNETQIEPSLFGRPAYRRFAGISYMWQETCAFADAGTLFVMMVLPA
jgi:hypothetical protein